MGWSPPTTNALGPGLGLVSCDNAHDDRRLKRAFAAENTIAQAVAVVARGRHAQDQRGGR